MRPRDEIGRRSGFKIRRRKACQFESGRGHQQGIFGPILRSLPMPPIPTVTKNLMLACTAIFCLQQIVFIDGLFALFPLASGNFMPWQVVTYAFLHGGMLHLFFNMLGLWMFGSELERLWGARRYWHFLLAGVLAAAVAQMIITCCWPSACCSPTASSCRCSRPSR
jgi:membrane associated rhomboid family serine protease